MTGRQKRVTPVDAPSIGSRRASARRVPQRRLLPLAVAREALPDRISIAAIDAIMEGAE
jgi:hypothetical protein